MKILVTGGKGQLARTMTMVQPETAAVVFLDRETLDICDPRQLHTVVQAERPDVVVNTAAYTQVDQAESEPEKAFAINEEGVKNLAENCREYGCKLIHISTDYVFDGTGSAPLSEADPTHPKTVYGKSKLAGEIALSVSGLEAYAIVRTSWLYSIFGNNFYKTMLRLADSRNTISVVDDQIGSPTYAPHLAQAVYHLAGQLSPANSGTYHYANTGSTTWFGLAKEIFERNKIDIKLRPIPTQDYPTPAPRPAYSVLDSEKIENVFGVRTYPWEKGVDACVRNL